MRKLKLLLLLALVCALAGMSSACSLSSQVENQAYAVALGVDRTEDGGLRLLARIPRIASGESGKTDAPSGGGSGDYTVLDVTASDFESALERLNWAAPRDLNLSQLKLLVISRELAEASDAKKLITSIARIEHLYMAVPVAVCSDSACDFVKALEPGIGTRLSTDIEATLEYYASQGFIPDASLAELYYRTESVYSDPMIAYALLNAPGEEQSGVAADAFALDGSLEEISDANASDIPTRYLGAAVFADGRMRGVFDARETIMASLLRNALTSFYYSDAGENVKLITLRASSVRVDTSVEPVQIDISVRLSVAVQNRMPDEAALEESLRADIEDTIRAAQRMDAEPFGFAERAAAQFATIEDWRNYNWRKHFKDARFNIDLQFLQINA